MAFRCIRLKTSDIFEMNWRKRQKKMPIAFPGETIIPRCNGTLSFVASVGVNVEMSPDNEASSSKPQRWMVVEYGGQCNVILQNVCLGVQPVLGYSMFHILKVFPLKYSQRGAKLQSFSKEPHVSSNNSKVDEHRHSRNWNGTAPKYLHDWNICIIGEFSRKCKKKRFCL